MALRKLMHPRNKYKKSPNFKQLALLYPEFRKVAVTDLTGKVHIDFKNEETLRILTKVLLKHDFDLTIKIPQNKLVPTLPLRLNYILWIEDLMTHASFTKMENVKGIDIGTGAVCIYPLLLAKIYGCYMFGTEVDDTSIESAIENVKNNNLENLIQVIKVDKNKILKETIEENETFHFIMCNPPFFETEDTSDKVIKQQPPRNAPTGSNKELSIEGGEKLFVTKMIEESIQIGEKIKIYTSMLGKKNSLFYFVKLLKEHNINNFTWTEFCQGHTKRWGLAWSFLSIDVCDLTKAPVIRESNIMDKFSKDHPPLEIIFPMQDKYLLIDDVIIELKKIINNLQINIKELELQKNTLSDWGCQLTAQNDTWSHARRKRRLAERQSKDCKKVNIESTLVTEQINVESEIRKTQHMDVKNEDIQFVSTKDTETSDHKGPLLIFNLFLNILEDEQDPEKKNVKISLFFESGSGGRNTLETLRQYLINKLNVRIYFQQFCSKTNKKRRKKFKKAKKDPSSKLNKLGKEKKLNISSAEDSADSF
ncbi:U6 small nuclear RNA (adenine-(43)-N(6))-methyltransferase [Vespa crabro]|uniref:U6 small nuclear RNA (adenine-(43)-N(6))-methyltransferase n=1 Tax=Vespa crabro TaxID=7445 RepID=UPI001EFF6F9C|nr:U6 small nuclear RNA (adenine-(43)-N(6))-methyltransferase [Vespa crabro]